MTTSARTSWLRSAFARTVIGMTLPAVLAISACKTSTSSSMQDLNSGQGVEIDRAWTVDLYKGVERSQGSLQFMIGASSGLKNLPNQEIRLKVVRSQVTKLTALAGSPKDTINMLDVKLK